MTSVSIRIRQSKLFPAVMSTLHKFCVQKDDNGGCFSFRSGFREYICLENFHKEYGKCVTTVPLFAETFNKEVSNVLCEKPIILVELLLKLRIVVIQDSQDGERTVCKKCARKIVNCYRMFAELREALASGRTLDKGEKLIASSCFKIKRSLPQIPSTACPSACPVPVRG